MDKKHSRNLIISGTIYTVILFLWPVFMFLSSGNAGSIEEKLNALIKNSEFYNLNFIAASLIAPSAILLISVISGLYKKESLGFFDTLGIVILVAYSILNSISYISQYSILSRLLEKKNIEAAKTWYFGNPDSLSYFLNQMGYCLFGIAVLLIFREFLKDKGLNKAVGILFYTSAVLSIIAFIGLLMQNNILNAATVASGLLIVPVGILAIIAGAKDCSKQV